MQANVCSNANVIYSAESEDRPMFAAMTGRRHRPTRPSPPVQQEWQAVDGSLALLESADLLNLRGHMCANGTPRTVDEHAQ